MQNEKRTEHVHWSIMFKTKLMVDFISGSVWGFSSQNPVSSRTIFIYLLTSNVKYQDCSKNVNRNAVETKCNYHAVLYCTALHCTALHCTALHCTVLYCTALHCIVLYCIVIFPAIQYFEDTVYYSGSEMHSYCEITVLLTGPSIYSFPACWSGSTQGSHLQVHLLVELGRVVMSLQIFRRNLRCLKRSQHCSGHYHYLWHWNSWENYPSNFILVSFLSNLKATFPSELKRSISMRSPRGTSASTPFKAKSLRSAVVWVGFRQQ